jgi:hypothetical protein
MSMALTMTTMMMPEKKVWGSTAAQNQPEATESDNGDDGEMWRGIESDVDLSHHSVTSSDSGEQEENQASTNTPFPFSHGDDDGTISFMPDEPEITLTAAEQAVASHAPSVRASMVLRNARQHGDVNYAVGEIVTLAIPANYRRSGDFSRFYSRVVDKPYHNLYQLRCEIGILRSLYPSNDLQSVPHEIATQYQCIITMTGSSAFVSLAAAARLASTGPPRLVVCKCQQQCTSTRCSCMKAGVQCSKRCHGSIPRACYNYSFLPSGVTTTPALQSDEPPPSM